MKDYCSYQRTQGYYIHGDTCLDFLEVASLLLDKTGRNVMDFFCLILF